MDLLTKQDINKYLELVNTKLSQMNKHGEIIIAGGAALTMVFNARNSTHDIDAIFHPKEDLTKIIKQISIENNIHDDWMNDAVKGFINSKMESTKYIEFSNLRVSYLNPQCLIAMKLISARPDTKDMDDSIFLMGVIGIDRETDLFEIIEKYTVTNFQTPQCYFLPRKLSKDMQ